MSTKNNKSEGFRLPILQGLLPINGSQIPTEIIAGLTLAALAIPEVMGYTKISGTPVITYKRLCTKASQRFPEILRFCVNNP